MYIINIRRHLQTHSSRVLLLTLTLIALYLRARALSSDPRVVWDAVHFGTFANNYIHREFFLDVHQPFGKLLITVLFQMFGYTGDYVFVSGERYSSAVPFVQMRRVQAMVGTLLVPLSFAMCRALRMPLVSAWLAAVFVTLENAFIGIARLNVLDNMLLVASAGAVSAFAVVERMHTKQQICTKHIVMLGLALTLLLNIKLTGVLTTAVIAAYVLNMLVCTNHRNQSISTSTVIWIKYAILLGVVPVATYVMSFWWHFAWQTNYTPQADNMGSEFSVQLIGSALQIQPPFIHSNSFIAMRAINYPFEYLDVLEHQDNRTKNRVLSTSRTLKVESYLGIALLGRSGVVNDGSLVALHAPKTEYFVSALDMQMSEIPSRRVGFVTYTNKQNPTPVAWKIVHEECAAGHRCATRPITTYFRLVSLEHGCELNIDYSHSFESSLDFNRPWLLSCTHHRGTIWSIEHQLATSDHPTTNISQLVLPNFIQNFVTYNRLMHDVNRMLISDPDQLSNFESRAWSWPFLLRPMQLVSWTGDELKYMLVGNVVLWRGSAIVCVLYPFVLLMSHVVRRRSHGKVVYQTSWSMNLVWTLWVANYLPFIFVSRVTYGHQYLTSLYFGIILLAAYTNQVAQILTPKLSLAASASTTRNVIIGALVLVVLGFVFSYPLTYGIFNPCDYSRYTWIPSWNICRHPL